MRKLLNENEALRQALQNIEVEYYRDCSNFDLYTLDEYVELRLEDILGA